MAVGPRIRAHRERLGWTQEQLADRAGKRAAQVSKWESGAIVPSLRIRQELAKALGIPVSELVDDATGPAPARVGPAAPQTTAPQLDRIEGLLERQNDLLRELLGTRLGRGALKKG